MMTLLLIALATQQHDMATEHEVVALTLLAEARGEGKDGMYAVAAVIRQRMENRNQTATEVCLAPKQFSCWNGKSHDDLEYLWRSSAAPLAIMIATNLHKVDPAIVRHADHYCTLDVNPYWSRDQVPVKVVGNHKFFKLN